MNKKPSNKKIINWIKNHIRPHFEWRKYSNHLYPVDDNCDDDLEKWKDKVKEHSVFGIKIKWRF